MSDTHCWPCPAGFYSVAAGWTLPLTLSPHRDSSMDPVIQVTVMVGLSCVRAKHYGRFLAPVSCGARAFLVLVGRVCGGQCEWGELRRCETSTRADPACVSRIWLDSASQPDWDPSLGLPFPLRPRVANQSPAIVFWLPGVGKRLRVGALKGATMRGNHCQLPGSALCCV